MKAVNRLCIVALALFVQLPVVAYSRDYSDGVAAYNRGDFRTASSKLSLAVRGADTKVALAHYYLANSLLQLNQRQQALAEYRICLQLDPNGAEGSFSEKAIEQLSSGIKTTSAGLNVSDTGDNSDHAAAGSPAVQLPTLPTIPHPQPIEGPTLSQLQNWSFRQVGNYYGRAVERRDKAIENLNEAQDLLKRAQGMVSPLTTSARQYGEDDAAAKVRIDQGKVKAAELLKPYEAYVQNRQTALDQENAVFEYCQSMSRRVY